MIGFFWDWFCDRCGYLNTFGKRCGDCGVAKPR